MKRLSIALPIISALICPPVLAESKDERNAVKVLESASSEIEKEAACRQLKRIGTAKSVPALASLLTDEPLAQWALSALETMPCPEAGQALVAGLYTTVAKTRAGIAHALGQRRDRRALPALVKLLTDPEVMVARTAAHAIGKIGGGDAIDALGKAKATVPASVRPAVIDALLACADRLLADSDAKGAAAIYRRMYESKEADHVRVAGYRGMVLSSGDRMIPLVVAGLKGSDVAAQLASIEFVSRIKSKDATRTFAALLAETQPKLRAALIDALSLRGDTAASEAVAAAAKSSNPAVRLVALKALARLGDASHAALLAESAVTGTQAERAAARFSLVCLGRGDVRGALLLLVEKARPEIQGKVIAVLGSRGDRETIPVLLKLAVSKREPANLASISALKKLADASQAGELLGLILHAQSDAARASAVTTFVHVGTRYKQREEFARRALKAMQGAKAPVRCSLLRAAGQLGGPSVLDALRASAKDPSADIRGAAIGTMADHAGVEALPVLLRLADQTSEDSLRASALKGYWRLVGLTKSRTPEQRLKLVRDGLAVGKLPDEKRRGLAELAKTPLPEALELARQACSDAVVKAEAEAACYQISTRLIYSHRREVEASLRGLAKEADSEGVRRSARAFVASLAKYGDFVVPWLVSPPYRQAGKNAQGLFDIPFPAEKPGASGVAWRLLPAPPVPANFWQADLSSIVGGNHCVVYAKTRVYCPKAQPIALEIGTDDGVKLWINGKLVHANNAVRGMAPAQDKAKAELKQGWNDFLAKITQHTLGCGMMIRITAANGSRIANLRFDPWGK